MKKSVVFDLRFGFLVKNCIYGQILVKIGQNPVKLIKNLKIFINLNLGLIILTLPMNTYCMQSYKQFARLTDGPYDDVVACMKVKMPPENCFQI